MPNGYKKIGRKLFPCSVDYGLQTHFLDISTLYTVLERVKKGEILIIFRRDTYHGVDHTD